MAEPRTKSSKYYLQYQGSEFGPLPWTELQAVITSGKIQGSFFIWTEGLDNWVRIQTVKELNRITDATTGRLIFPRRSKSATMVVESRNRRGGNRWPVIATVALVDKRALRFIGICREISASGMSIVVDRNVKLELGSLVEIEVRPITLTGLSPFRLTCRVLWDRPAESSVGFLFSTIAKVHREALARYVTAVEKRMLKL